MPEFNDILGEEQIKKNLGFDGVNPDIEAVTYACYVMDHSGSMGGPVDEGDENSPTKDKMAIENFNEHLAVLKKDADEDMQVLVSIVEFDDEIKNPVVNKDVNTMEPEKHYWLGGTTALYDAIAYGIHVVKTNMEKDPREDKAAIIVVQTDGWENASTDYNKEENGRQRIMDKIKELENSGNWTFVFLGAKIDEKVATELGINSGNLNIAAGNVRSAQAAYYASTQGMGDYLKARKRGMTQTMNFFDTKVEAKNKDEDEDEDYEKYGKFI